MKLIRISKFAQMLNMSENQQAYIFRKKYKNITVKINGIRYIYEDTAIKFAKNFAPRNSTTEDEIIQKIKSFRP